MANAFLNICTWNATGIMSSATYLSNSLKYRNVDICGISEHWLYEKDLHFLNQIDNYYNSYAVSDNDLKLPGSRKVGKGVWPFCGIESTIKIFIHYLLMMTG